MDVILTLTLKDFLLLFIGIGLIILIFYCIMAVKNMVPCIKNINKILEDSTVVSGVVARTSEEAEEAIGDVAEALGSVSEIIKGNQSVISAFSCVVNAIASLKNLSEKVKKTVD